MNLMKLLMIFVAGAMIFSCASTSGQVGTRYSSSMFEAIDQNHNGVIEKDEFLAAAVYRNQANQIFNQVDLNKDNVISRGEAEQNKSLMEQTIMKREALRMVGPQ